MKRTEGRIWLLASLVFLCMFNLTFIVPSVKELIVDRFDASTTQASLFVTVEMVAYIIFGMIWGAVSDKRGERRVFIAMGFLGSSLIYYTMSLAPDLVTLLLLRFVQGALTVMAWSLLMTLALDTASKERYGASMGVVGTGLALGLGFGAPVGGFLAGYGTLVPLYGASALFLLATAITVVFVKDAPIEHRTESIVRAMVLALRRREVLPPYLYSFAERFSAGFLVLLFPLFMADEFGASPQIRGMYLAAFLLPFALLQYPFGKLSDRRGRFVMLVGGGIAYAAMFAVIGMMDEGFLAPVMIVCGLFAAMILPASLALIGDVATDRERATFMGGFNAVGSLGFALGPLLAAYFSEAFGYPSAFLLGGAVICVTVLASIPLLPERAARRRR
jgi:MFS family permease